MDKLMGNVKNNREIFFSALLFVLLNIFAVHANAALVWGSGLWGEVWDDVDTDGDGLKDSEETNIYHTNPLRADTDHDTLSDGWEVAHGRNPLVADYQVSAGVYHACALDDVGVHCWGDNYFGETTVPALVNPVSVSAGGDFTCALDDSGVHCWGLNDQNQIDVPVLVNPTHITTGANHACALDVSGVHCWGNSYYGQTNMPVLVNPREISASYEHTCALDDNGVHCWGGNQDTLTSVPVLVNPVQISANGYHVCALDDYGVHCWGGNNNGESDVPALVNPIQVVAGGYHTCAIDDSGVHCWGADWSGQSTNIPTLVHSVQLSLGGSYSCVLDGSGVHCWGDNGYGQTNVPTLMIDPDGDSVTSSQDCYPYDNTQSACAAGTYPTGTGFAQAPAGSYAINGVLSQCAAGTYQPLTGQSSCITVSVCNSNQYQTVAPTITSDRVCSALTLCSATQYQSVAPTSTTDRVCAVRKPNDFSPDGKADILLRNTNTGQFFLTTQNGLTVLNQSVVGAFSDLENVVVSTADFDGNGSADILTRGTVDGVLPGTFRVELTAGATITSAAWMNTMSSDLNDVVMSTKDFNKDGKADVLLRNSVTGVWTINYMNGVNNPTIGTLNASTDLCYTMQGDGDYDGNGYPDILLRRDACGGASYPWLVQTLQGSFTILASGTAPGVTMNIGWGAMVTDRDFNGDGKTDILMRDRGASPQLWLEYDMNGVGAPSSSGQLPIAVQSMWQLAADADFNGDGKADLLIRSVDTGQWYAYLMNDRAVLSSGAISMEINPIWSLQALDDNNGDAKSDILLRNNAGGAWYLYLMNGVSVSSKAILPLTYDLGYTLQND